MLHQVYIYKKCYHTLKYEVIDESSFCIEMFREGHFIVTSMNIKHWKNDGAKSVQHALFDSKRKLRASHSGATKRSVYSCCRLLSLTTPHCLHFRLSKQVTFKLCI